MTHPDFTAVDAILQSAVPQGTPAAQLTVRRQGYVVLSQSYGWLDPETHERRIRPDTLFDLASVTKLFVVSAFMALVDAGRVGIDQRVSEVLPGFHGLRPVRPYEDPLAPGGFVTVTETDEPVDAGQITFRQLLTHTSGLPAWRPLFQRASYEAARLLAVETAFAYPPGTRIVYSDIGLILIGMAIEHIAGLPLDQVVATQITKPLGLVQTRYLPIDPQGPLIPGTLLQQTGLAGAGTSIAPTEQCAWRGRRIVGEVHDENAAGLGGVSGHAGLFSTADDVAKFGQLFLDGGRPLLRAGTVDEMARLQAKQGDTRRGIGFALWSPDPEASGNPFSQGAFGHTGFTGTSLWMDAERQLVVALLTNEVYHGRTNRRIGQLRVAVHTAVVQAIDLAAGDSHFAVPARTPGR
jgi:CubicO group peptidase (beta-lactamase class C family)